MDTKTICVTRTVVCPLVTSRRKVKYLRDCIEEYQSCLSTMAAVLPSLDRSEWGKTTTMYRVATDRCDVENLYSQEVADAAYKVSSSFESRAANGHAGEWPSFGEEDYIRSSSSATGGSPDDSDVRFCVVENDSGYGLYTTFCKYHGDGRGSDPEWFHIQGGEYQYEQLERIANGGASLCNVEIHCDGEGNAEAHMSYTVDVAVPKKGEADTYIGVDVGDRTLYAVAVCDGSGTVRDVAVESGAEQRHHRDRLERAQQRRQRSGSRTRATGVSERQRYTEQVMHTASRRIVDVASEYAPCAIVIEDLTNYREDAPNPIHDWPFASLQEKLCYKANAARIRVIEVASEYTSITCRHCGVTNKQSRDGLNFACVNCGYEVHADVNAAINIAGRGCQKDTA
jgi:IS605 OrfB family transposase